MENEQSNGNTTIHFRFKNINIPDFILTSNTTIIVSGCIETEKRSFWICSIGDMYFSLECIIKNEDIISQSHITSTLKEAFDKLTKVVQKFIKIKYKKNEKSENKEENKEDIKERVKKLKNVYILNVPCQLFEKEKVKEYRVCIQFRDKEQLNDLKNDQYEDILERIMMCINEREYDSDYHDMWVKIRECDIEIQRQATTDDEIEIDVSDM